MSKLVYFIYRLSFLAYPYSRIVATFFVLFNRVVWGVYISPTAIIHKSVRFGYQGLGIVIGGCSELREGVEIGQNVTIGGRSVSVPGRGPWPIICSNSFIGPHSCVLGPVLIGSNVIIGANSVVISDCDSNGIYAGSPARFIRHIRHRIVGDQYEL